MGQDLLDTKILYHLNIDARQTDSHIAKKVETSQQVVNYRIKNLIEKEIIMGFMTTINFGYFGFSNYRIMIKLGNISKKEKESLLNQLANTQNVMLLSECGGKWDIILNIMAENNSRFQERLSRILKEHDEFIINYDTFTTIDGVVFGKNYLDTPNEKKNKILFGKEEKTNISKTELIILQELSKNARISISDMEKKLKINHKTILEKIKSMKAKNIITSFKPAIDTTKRGYFMSKIFLDLNRITEKEYKCLQDFLHLKGEVIGIMRMIGKWNYEIALETLKQEDTWRLYQEIQEYLKNKIRDDRLVPVFKKHMYNYFPESLLK